MHANDQAELQADRDISFLKSRNRLAIALLNMVKRGFEHRLNLRLNLLLDLGRVHHVERDGSIDSISDGKAKFDQQAVRLSAPALCSAYHWFKYDLLLRKS